MKHCFRTYFSFLLLLLFVQTTFAHVNHPETQTAVKFAENKNQWPLQVLYRAQLDGGLLFLEKDCFTYSFYDKDALRENHHPQSKNKLKGSFKPVGLHAFRMSFVAANPNVTTDATQMTPDYCNYFIGNDKSKWASDVKNYREVNYRNLYKGIDLQVLGLQNSIKYNFIVAPGADESDVKLYYEGLDKIELVNGELRLTTSLNEMVEQKPYAYQVIGYKKVEVPCRFVLENNTVSFAFPKGFDKRYTLVIDPVLVFAASSGSLADNFGMTATYDANGNLYSGGTVFGQGYPTTVGAYDITYNGIVAIGITDVVVTKYNANGTSLIYSTYLGGAASTEIVTSLVVSAQDELFLYGATGSNDFPVTANAFDKTFNGGRELYFDANGTYYYTGTDIYVSRFNATGTALLASTYLGGSDNDGININEINVVSPIQRWDPVAGSWVPIYTSQSDSLQYNYGDQYRGEINLDKHGDVFIASSTRSTNFPIINGIDNSLGGRQDAIVVKLSSDLSQVKWSTYLGGSNNDAGYALALDSDDNVYVTGGTRSANFPVTPDGVQTINKGGKAEGYISKIKSDGTSILHSTYWGTAAYDQCYFVQLDKNNNVYVVGQSEGVMPVTDSSKYYNAGGSQFISKFNDSLNTLVFSTVFGNGGNKPNISPSAFLVDYCDNIYVSGWGGNIETGVSTLNMPLKNAYQSTTDGFNFYLFVLSKDAASLQYASYFGGAQSQEHVDGGTSRFDKKGIVYQSVCAGCGGHDDFPVTPGAWPKNGTDVNRNTQNNNCNNGVFKFDFEIPLVQANFTVNKIEGCGAVTVNFQNQSTTGASFLWDFGGGDTTSTLANPVRTFSTPGEYLVKLYVTNNAACNYADTTFQYITVHPLPVITNTLSATNSICSGNALNIPLTSNMNSTFTWVAANNTNVTGESTTTKTTATINDALTNTSSVNQTVTYTVTPISVDNQCAGTPVQISALVYPTPSVSTAVNNTICSGSTANISLSANVNSTFKWAAINNTNVGGETVVQQTTNNINDVLTNISGANQTVNYTVTPTSTVGACVGNSTTISVLVGALPSVTTPNVSICSGVQLNASLTSDVTSTYTWVAQNNTNTTGESVTAKNTNIINDLIVSSSSSVQTVTYSVVPTSQGANCKGSTKIVTATIYPPINSDFDFKNVSCTKTISFSDSSKTSPASWAWDFGDGNTSNQQNPQHTYSASGNFDVELISSNTYNCKDTAVIELEIDETAFALQSEYSICKGDAVQLVASGGSLYDWNPSANLDNSAIAAPLASPVATTTYTVQIAHINSLGDTCSTSLSTTVTVTDPDTYTVNPTADKDTLYLGESTVIHSNTPSGLKVNWISPTSNPLSAELNVTITPEVTTTYTVSILEKEGCPKSGTITIYVIQCDPASVFVPNTFTPDGDGKNDILYVRGNEITELYFAVYNRWGQMVFETKDITKGWNGMYNGMKADPAVFAWYLKAKCYNGEDIEKKGNVTLIR